MNINTESRRKFRRSSYILHMELSQTRLQEPEKNQLCSITSNENNITFKLATENFD